MRGRCAHAPPLKLQRHQLFRLPRRRCQRSRSRAYRLTYPRLPPRHCFPPARHPGTQVDPRLLPQPGCRQGGPHIHLNRVARRPDVRYGQLQGVETSRLGWAAKLFNLRGPSWIKRCSSRPFVAHAAELRGSPTLCRASFACLSSSSWINLPFQPTQKGSAKQPSTERPPSRKSQEILQILLQTTFTRNPRQTHPKILG